MTENLPIAPAAGLPALGPSPLIKGEDPAAYDDLVARIRAVLRPADVIEEIWARDIADLAWEVFRLRRLKASLMQACAYDGLADVLDALKPHWIDAGANVENNGNNANKEQEDDSNLPERWATGDQAAIAKVDGVLASAGLTIDAVMAQTLSNRIDIVERIERMMTAAESRRDTILREAERRRSGAASRLRRAMHDAEDAEFEVVASARAEAAE
jgi:hypothetical protein